MHSWDGEVAFRLEDVMEGQLGGAKMEVTCEATSAH